MTEDIRELAGAGVLAGAFLLTGLVLVFEASYAGFSLAVLAWLIGFGLMERGHNE